MNALIHLFTSLLWSHRVTRISMFKSFNRKYKTTERIYNFLQLALPLAERWCHPIMMTWPTSSSGYIPTITPWVSARLGSTHRRTRYALELRRDPFHFRRSSEVRKQMRPPIITIVRGITWPLGVSKSELTFVHGNENMNSASRQFSSVWMYFSLFDTKHFDC